MGRVHVQGRTHGRALCVGPIIPQGSGGAGLLLVEAPAGRQGVAPPRLSPFLPPLMQVSVACPIRRAGLSCRPGSPLLRGKEGRREGHACMCMDGERAQGAPARHQQPTTKALAASCDKVNQGQASAAGRERRAVRWAHATSPLSGGGIVGRAGGRQGAGPKAPAGDYSKRAKQQDPPTRCPQHTARDFATEKRAVSPPRWCPTPHDGSKVWPVRENETER